MTDDEAVAFMERGCPQCRRTDTWIWEQRMTPTGVTVAPRCIECEPWQAPPGPSSPTRAVQRWPPPGDPHR